MKKAISLLLSLVLLFCVCLPAFGAEEAHRVNERIYTVLTSDRQMTIDDFEGTPFYVFDQKTDITEPMTAENCHTEHWTADRQQDDPQSFLQKIRNAFQSFFRWCKAALFELLKERAAQKNAE